MKESTERANADAAVPKIDDRNPPKPEKTRLDQDGFPILATGNPFFPPGASQFSSIGVDGQSRMSAKNASLPEMVSVLGRMAGAPIVDRTGLTEKYDFHLKFVPKRAGAPQSPEPGAPLTAADPGVNMIDTVEDQLGLRLEPAKVPVEMVVIDHLEKVPAEN